MRKGYFNIRKIAELAGVSIASVSRALQDTPSKCVSDDLRRRILAICEAHHYYPNEHTRRMFAGRSRTISFLYPAGAVCTEDSMLDIDLNFSVCLASAQETLAQNGYGLLLNEMNGSQSGDSILRMVRGRAVDGALVWGFDSYEPWLQQLVKEGAPVLMLQTKPAGCPCPVVASDDYSGMSGVVERAVRAGHRRFALLSAPQGSSVGESRNRAVQDTLARHGLELALVAGKGGFGYQAGRRLTKTLLPRLNGITCIIASNDMAAWGCIDTLRADGLAVPADISVIGADGLRFPGDVRIDSFGLPSREIGRQGAQLLLELLDGNSEVASALLPVKQVKGTTLRRMPK
ncbi:MAG: LacI family DNA-binding transcriptional regulator [Victivallales bacterium]|nr:LacI family DNA-binding transcriptional regulator [Victivallales bacterium]